MEKDKQIELVSAAQLEIDDVHDPVGLLQEVKGLFPLLSFDELDSGIVQFAEDNGYLVLGDPELLVVMLVEGVIFIEGAPCGPICLVI